MKRRSGVIRPLALALSVPLTLLLADCGGSSDSPPPPLSAAFFVGDLEYQFDYQLDGQGRVDSYRVARRAGIQYPVPIASDANVRECTGSLHGTYQCTSNAGSMKGEAGRLVESQSGPAGNSSAYAYSYGDVGLVRVVRSTTGPGSHDASVGTVTLTYNASGRPGGVLEETKNLGPACILSVYTGAIALDSTGRLLSATRTSITPTSLPPECSTWSVVLGGPRSMEWTYNSTGPMQRSVSTSFSAQGVVNSRSTTTYEADALGWLAARSVLVEDGSAGTTQTDDTYGVTRDGGRITEERFTQAEPRNFYTVRAAQRVRYEAGRLPAEPLFIPRVPTGMKGDDYFGIISSHQR